MLLYIVSVILTMLLDGSKMNGITGNGILWLLLGIPAILAWIAYGMAWLLAPHLVGEVSQIHWALYTAGGWYLILFVLAGGCTLMLP